MDELSLLGVDPVSSDWIKSFLTNRTQAVYTDNTLAEWKNTQDGIPQGTKMGVALFSIMINRVLRKWNIRSKYEDDNTLLEIIHHNLISILNLAVRHT